MAIDVKAPCWCGRGCNGPESVTDRRVRSERDAIAKYLQLHGPMPVFAEGQSDPVHWIESMDDPHVDGPVVKPVKPGENREPDPIRAKREAEAIEYATNYVGTWGLPKDIRAHRAWGTKHMRLSDRQIEVLLEGKARDLAREAARLKVREQTGRDLRVLPYGKTRAAVDNDEGHLTFLVFDRPEVLDHYKQPNKWHGWVFVRQHLGGRDDRSDPRIGSQRPNETYSGQWPNLIDKVLADPEAAVVRYGRELGVCGVCNTDLTNEESREAGIGPVCRKRMRESAAALAEGE